MVSDTGGDPLAALDRMLLTTVRPQIPRRGCAPSIAGVHAPPTRCRLVDTGCRLGDSSVDGLISHAEWPAHPGAGCGLHASSASGFRRRLSALRPWCRRSPRNHNAPTEEFAV